MTQGVVYVAFGHPARREARKSIASLWEYSSYPVAVMTDTPFWPKEAEGSDHNLTILMKDTDPGARRAKLALPEVTPFEYTCYLDADTEVRGPLGVGFEILRDGWDLAICPSTRQAEDVLGNCSAQDRHDTFGRWGIRDLVGFQAGVFFFRRTDKVRAFFQLWRKEWERFREMDQGAFLRALYHIPLRIWVLSNAFNGGDVVEHHFGYARARLP